MLAGKNLAMSLLDNKTGMLWGSFMPVLKQIKHRVSDNLYSLQDYPATYFDIYNPGTVFTNWALTEVSTRDVLPEGMKHFKLEGGLYAVFLHRGSDTDTSTYQYIFSTWLPQSDYVLDHRPHFELLGSRYKKGDDNSEEEFWIPVKEKQKA